MVFTNKIVFSSYCQTYLKKRFGANKLVTSFKYFHPNIPFVLYEDEDINRVYKKYNVNYSNALPCIMLDAKQRFDANFICHIDADSLVLGKLDSILEMDYEVASCRNDCDNHTQKEIETRPIGIKDIDNSEYVSCGCVSTNSVKFLENWNELNQYIVKIYGGVISFWMSDQNAMNLEFHSEGNKIKDYKTKILDPKGGKVFYGPSANMYYNQSKVFIPRNDDPEHIMKEYGINGHQSYREILYKNNEFWLYGKKIKLSHFCSGGNPKTAIKNHFSLFNNETRKKLQEITGIIE